MLVDIVGKQYEAITYIRRQSRAESQYKRINKTA